MHLTITAAKVRLYPKAQTRGHKRRTKRSTKHVGKRFEAGVPTWDNARGLMPRALEALQTAVSTSVSAFQTPGICAKHDLAQIRTGSRYQD